MADNNGDRWDAPAEQEPAHAPHTKENAGYAQKGQTLKESWEASKGHPFRWFAGKNFAPERVRPWEFAVQCIPGFFNGFLSGFSSYNHELLYTNKFGSTKSKFAVAQIIYNLWDAINDPLLGSYMDARHFASNILKTLMRISALVGAICQVFPMINWFGIGEVAPEWKITAQLAVLVFSKSIADTIGTASGVASSKVFARITPDLNQRGWLLTAAGYSSTFKEMVAYIPSALFGLTVLQEKFPILQGPGNSIYYISLLGTLVFFLPQAIANMFPSFVRQRWEPEETENQEKVGYFEGLKEAFRIIKYNNYAILGWIANFITVFTPAISGNSYWMYTMPKTKWFGGKDPIGGMTLLPIISSISSPVAQVAQAVSPVWIRGVGGPRNMQIINQGVAILGNLGKFLFMRKLPDFANQNRHKMDDKGYIPGIEKLSFPRLGGYLAMDMLMQIPGRIDSIAGGMINYEMYDYVEWKTGKRSEGAKTAVDGLFSKLLAANVNRFTGGFFEDWMGFKPNSDTQSFRYQKWATRLIFFVPAVDAAITLIFRFLYRYPGDKAQVEAELLERRKILDGEQMAVND
ncbi:MAG: MFS transporter [Oscillospiraceae bacterium]|jgi:Na+/melibiose symporter-like transporter|nr:MFS transporter [Oscillospiraceae bacterium]